MPLKALILVGGYGTRLRPLTFDSPKPLVPFANKAIVMHQIEALVKVGVDEIVLAVSYQSDVMKNYLDKRAKELGIKIVISKEDEPLGTGGPIALAREHLTSTDPFFVLNSDVICEYPFNDLLEFHRSHGKEGTIFVTKVEDPSKYGVVVSNREGRIKQFVEKPVEFVGDEINAGIYIFNSSMINRIKPVPTSIEREVFPAMAADGDLFKFTLPNFWMDIGQPRDYLRGQVLYLESQRNSDPGVLATGKHIVGNVLIDPSAKIGEGCKIGPDVVIGPNVVVENFARIQRSAILEGCKIGHSTVIKSSIVGWESIIKPWAHIEEGVLGKDVTVAPEVVLNQITVCPHKGVKANEFSSRVII